MKTTLPSGLEVELRPTSLFVLLKTGKIPAAFTPMVKAMVAGKQPSADDLEKQMKDLDTITEFASFYVDFAKMAMVSPKLVEGEAGEGEVSMMDLTDSDFVFIFIFTQKAKAADVEPFRGEGGEPDKAIGDGEDVQPPAE